MNQIPSHPQLPKKMPFLSDATYNALKFIAQIVLPGVGALYFGLASIWGLPHAEEIVGTITVFDTFLGVLLGFSTRSYNKSDAKYDAVVAVEQPETGPAQLRLRSDLPEQVLLEKSELLFKVES